MRKEIYIFHLYIALPFVTLILLSLFVSWAKGDSILLYYIDDDKRFFTCCCFFYSTHCSAIVRWRCECVLFGFIHNFRLRWYKNIAGFYSQSGYKIVCDLFQSWWRWCHFIDRIVHWAQFEIFISAAFWCCINNNISQSAHKNPIICIELNPNTIHSLLWQFPY
jgi:hypothetical protein